MSEQLANLAESSLAKPVPAAESGASEVIELTSVARFPTEPTFELNLGLGELGEVTAVSGVKLTVTRGVSNTSAVAHAAGSTVKVVITAEGLGRAFDAKGAAASAQVAAEAASDKAGAAATAQTAAEAVSIPLAQKGAGSGVASLTAGGIGAQPPAHHASTHGEGGTDPLTTADLPVSVVSSSSVVTAGLLPVTIGGDAYSWETPAAIGLVAGNHTWSASSITLGSALPALTTGKEIYTLGIGAGEAITSAVGCILIGENAGNAITTGGGNIGLGKGTLKSLKIGIQNIAIGETAMNLAGGEVEQNIAIGSYALYSISASPGPFNKETSKTERETSKGRYNIAIGQEVMKFATEALSCVAVGANAMLKCTTGEYNTAIGEAALRANETGVWNTAIGQLALALFTGSEGTALGAQAGAALTTGANNTIVGFQALNKCVTGANNTIMGWKAAFSATGGTNTIIGSRAGEEMSSAGQNTGVGSEALRKLGTGFNNCAFGKEALLSVAAGSENVAIGSGALKLMTKSKNVAIGYNAGEENVSGEGCVFIGFEAGKKETGSNKLYIANSSTAEPLILGNFNLKELTLYATKLGLYGVAPVERYKTTGTSGGFTAKAGEAVKAESTFTGATGSTAYTIGDIVKALKLVGLVAE
jgi:hypothetical protein